MLKSFLPHSHAFSLTRPKPHMCSQLPIVVDDDEDDDKGQADYPLSVVYSSLARQVFTAEETRWLFFNDGGN